MDFDAKGKTVIEVEKRVEPVKLAELAEAVGTDTGIETSRLTLFFGPTVAGEKRLIDVLDLDPSRALLAGQSYEWARPFDAGELLSIRVSVEDVFLKGENTFGVVATEIRDVKGLLIQSQRTTFIERSAG